MLIDIYFCFGIMADEAGAAHIFATLIYFYIVNMFDIVFHAMKLLLYLQRYGIDLICSYDVNAKMCNNGAIL